MSGCMDEFEALAASLTTEQLRAMTRNARQLQEDASRAREVLPQLLERVRRPGDSDADAARRLIEGGR